MRYLDRNDMGAISVLEMVQPDSLNALSDGMLAALQEAVDDIGAAPHIKVVILKGAGKAFCAGHNLKEMQAARAAEDQGAAAFEDLFARCAKLMLSLRALPQIVIAQVHGIATAAGCQLAATCDMVVAEKGARFGVNGINIGLFCSTPMVALTRAIGQKAAFEMLTTGRFINADEALELGLATRVAEKGALDEDTMALAQELASKLGSALRHGKGVFYAQAELPEAQAYDLTGRVMVANTLDDDTNEGIAAFVEKRKPDWDHNA